MATFLPEQNEIVEASFNELLEIALGTLREGIFNGGGGVDGVLEDATRVRDLAARIVEVATVAQARIEAAQLEQDKRIEEAKAMRPSKGEPR